MKALSFFFVFLFFAGAAYAQRFPAADLLEDVNPGGCVQVNASGSKITSLGDACGSGSSGVSEVVGADGISVTGGQGPTATISGAANQQAAAAAASAAAAAMSAAQSSVQSVVAGSGISVSSTDAQNPVVSWDVDSGNYMYAVSTLQSTTINVASRTDWVCVDFAGTANSFSSSGVFIPISSGGSVSAFQRVGSGTHKYAVSIGGMFQASKPGGVYDVTIQPQFKGQSDSTWSDISYSSSANDTWASLGYLGVTYYAPRIASNFVIEMGPGDKFKVKLCGHSYANELGAITLSGYGCSGTCNFFNIVFSQIDE